MVARYTTHVAVLLIAVVLVASCGGATSSQPPAATASGAASGSVAPSKTHFTVYTALSGHQGTLDANLQAFKDTLTKAGLDVTFVDKNAEGQTGNSALIAKEIVQQNPDLIYVAGTPIVIALSQETKTIPIIFGIMTDPVGSKVVDSLDHPGRNLTGTANMIPASVFYDLIQDVLPNTKNVGMIGNLGDESSKATIDASKAEAAKRGINVIVAPIASSNDILGALKSLNGRVDFLYTPSDTMVQTAIDTVAKLCVDMHIPLVTTGRFATNGALLGVGADFVQMGQVAGEQAIKVLRNQAKPADIAVWRQTSKESVLVEVNMKTAQALNLTLPADILKQAQQVGK